MNLEMEKSCKKAILRAARMAVGTRSLMAFGSLLLIGSSASAQSSDALIDTLIKKGVLTVDEGNDLRQQADNDFTKAVQVKNGMPDWVTSLKINGDFRGRFEEFYADHPGFTTRNRYRIRARLGVVATIQDDLEVGMRFTTADANNPVSANATLQGNATRKPVNFDAAYAKWSPIHEGPWTGSVVIGKFDNPFQVSNMVFDYDYVPEGAAIQGGYQLNDHHAFKAIGAYYVLAELNQANVTNSTGSPLLSDAGGLLKAPGHDPAVEGAQLVWDAKWTKKLDSQVGVSFYNLSGKDNLGTYLAANNIANINSGNTRTSGTSANPGRLVYDYNPFVISENMTYRLDSFPGYPGAVPVKVFGEYINNPAAPSKNEGYRVGLTLGKAGEKKKWEVTYRYQSLGGDAWYEELVDEDNGAFYANTIPGDSGFLTSRYGNYGNWRGGTNIRGHQFQFQYSFSSSASFVFTYYLNTVIDKFYDPSNPNVLGDKSASSHFMADLMFKF